MAPKKGGRTEPPGTSGGVTGKEIFWSSLNDEDRKLATAFDCATPDQLQQAKSKKKAQEAKAQEQQRQTLRQNERNRQWEKDEQKKQREKAREESKQAAELEKVKKRAFAEKVVEAYWDGEKSWAEIGPGTWKEVQGEFFCTLCEKSPNGNNLESHLNSENHKKKLAWATGVGYAASVPATPMATAMPATCVPVPVLPQDLPSWQQLGPDGMLRCIPCGKVVDDNHLMTGDHSRRLQAFLEQEKLKTSGFAPPQLEYLAYVPWDENDPSSERCMKCLLCGKWAQDETSHTGTPNQPQGSKEHQKNLRNYEWHRKNVLEQRQKYHPSGPTRSTAAPKAVAKAPAPPTPAPWQASAKAMAQPALPAPATPAPWQ
ncbi:unnamed protein product, partial [Symbiodinium sp. CCMP2456]